MNPYDLAMFIVFCLTTITIYAIFANKDKVAQRAIKALSKLLSPQTNDTSSKKQNSQQDPKN